MLFVFLLLQEQRLNYDQIIYANNNKVLISRAEWQSKNLLRKLIENLKRKINPSKRD